MILNKNNSEAVKQLDRMMENGSFDSALYDSMLEARRIKSNYTFEETEILNKESFLKYYNPEVGKLFNTLSEFFVPTKEMLQKGNDKDLLNIFKTTNRKNIDTRLKLINKYHDYLCANDYINKNETITELSKLFESMEKDKYVNSFVNKIVDKISSHTKAKDLNEAIAVVPSKDLNIFRGNILRILAMTEGETRVKALQTEIRNPFFETKGYYHHKEDLYRAGYRKRPSLLKNAKRRLINSFNILRSWISGSGKTIQNIPATSGIEKVETKTNVIKPVINETVSSDIKKQVVVSSPKEQSSLTKVVEEIKPEVKDSTSVEQTVQVPVTTSKPANEITIKDTVLDFVSKKLGVKTFDRQKVEFADKATKMRFAMLPEIFASIADTRKADRFIGKKKILSSNKDALDLYKRINGNNKKFINYLLKKRNVDNSRMFEVKEIIAMIDKAEAKIAAAKKADPNYRARDARKYYNHLYEAKIQQYGKLTRPKNINKK